MLNAWVTPLRRISVLAVPTSLTKGDTYSAKAITYFLKGIVTQTPWAVSKAWSMDETLLMSRIERLCSSRECD